MVLGEVKEAHKYFKYNADSYKANSCKVSVHDEWSPLEEIIVGVVENARLPQPDPSVRGVDFPGLADRDIPTGQFSDRVIEETQEDLENLVATLSGLGVTVRRPQVTDHSICFSTPNWSSSGHYNYCPRDLFLAIGNQIIETPSPSRSRYFELEAYKEIFLDYFNSGARWFSAPKPMLRDELFTEPNSHKNGLLNCEIAFDAANIIRLGRDILYQVSDSGNELGAKWLQSSLGEDYRVHQCMNVYLGKHIDTTFTIVRPGLIVINPERVNDDNLPTLFRNWDKIWCPDPVDIGYEGYPLSSIWIAMNFIMVNPDLAIIDKRQVALIKELEARNVEVIGLQLRHARTLGGGFHCVTNDVRRSGSLENYF